MATQNGFKLRWDYEFISLREDKETGKVHSTIRDILSGDVLTVVSNYVCGADGAKSVVARELQLPFQDTPGGGFALNVWFEADLVGCPVMLLASIRLQTNRISLASEASNGPLGRIATHGVVARQTTARLLRPRNHSPSQALL